MLFRLGPPGLAVLLRSHSARLIGNRDSRNVSDAAKRGSGGRLVHSFTQQSGCRGSYYSRNKRVQPNPLDSTNILKEVISGGLMQRWQRDSASGTAPCSPSKPIWQSLVCPFSLESSHHLTQAQAHPSKIH
ncbi:hypothetical protein Q7C36_008077 [Tachysurus vachellii]|uniref:Uncharacterized protein n=1 Tax=Tachysurus vachellii TaxID=175792 RepID=A0AA88NCK8_TACVA|nr:hypothetical protein Q7C36_008077 [Tachysurus vachellii]